MKIGDLMNRIRLQEIVLPEFQREYVWDVEQALKLFQSLYRAYPMGSLLFWETTTPPVTKHALGAAQVGGQQLVILDGQQRLTALYLLTEGALPPYYGLHEIKHDPRALLFDLVTGTFHLPQVGAAASPGRIAVSDCFRDYPDLHTIAKAITRTQDGPVLAGLMEQCANNLSRLRSIRDYDYPVQTVPISASLDEAIDIFDRVNSSGTKLTAAELALTHISGKWPEARQTMKALLHQLATQHFHFDLDFLVRNLAGVVSGHAQLAELHRLPAATIQASWERLAVALTSAIALLQTRAAIASDAQLSSADVLIPLTVYLVRHGGAFPSEQATRRAIYWLYAATMWGRYTSEADQRLAYDLSIVRRSDEPWGELVDALSEQRGRIDVRAADLEGRGPNHPLSRMAQVALAAQGATDWSTGIPLAAVPQVENYPLFPPPAQLDTLADHVLRKQTDEIANQVFLINAPPQQLLDLLPMLAERQSQLLEQHSIPNDANLWQTRHLNAFLSTRRERIAAAINMHLQTFQDSFGPPRPFRSIAELIAAGESIGVEFKSTLRFSTTKGVKDMELEQEVAKTIAAFLNSEGGILVIGVEDNGTIYGIERDLENVQSKNTDGFELALRSLIRTRMGPEYNLYVRTHFAQASGKTVCVLRVYRSSRPVFCTARPPTKKGEAPPEGTLTFFVRVGNLSQSMSPAEVNSYIAMHWGA